MVTVELSYAAGDDDDDFGLAAFAGFFWTNQVEVGFDYPSLTVQERRFIRATRTTLRAEAPAASLTPLLRHYAEMVADPQPVFPFLDLSTPKRIVGGELRRELSDPRRQAIDCLDESMGHARPGLNEELAALGRLERDDATTFLRAHVQPNKLLLVIVGDVSEDATLAGADAAFGGIATHPGPPLRRARGSTAPLPSRIVVIDHPGDVQTAIAIGAELQRTASVDDETDADAVAAIIGGAITARANQRTRLHAGNTYGAAAHVRTRRWGRVFLMESSAEADETASTVSGLLDAVKSLQELPPSAHEIQMARTRTFGPGATSATALASWLTGWLDSDEELQAFVERTSRNSPRTPEKLQELARTYVSRERMRIVLVGDASKILPQLAAAGLGPAEVRRRPPP